MRTVNGCGSLVSGKLSWGDGRASEGALMFPILLTGAIQGDVPFAAEVGESGRLLCTPILSSDVATFLRGAGRDELMKRVGQRGHLAKPAHATKLLFCLEDR